MGRHIAVPDDSLSSSTADGVSVTLDEAVVVSNLEIDVEAEGDQDNPPISTSGRDATDVNEADAPFSDEGDDASTAFSPPLMPSAPRPPPEPPPVLDGSHPSMSVASSLVLSTSRPPSELQPILDGSCLRLILASTDNTLSHIAKWWRQSGDECDAD